MASNIDIGRISQSSPAFGRLLDIELTERCNNNCMHCCINLPADCKAAKARELSTKTILNIIEQAVSLGYLRVRFTGGEPLLRDDFSDLYLSTRRMGMKVLLFTNAMLITPDTAEMFSRVPPLEDIEITLYGMNKRSYEAASRTPGSFEAAWRGIHLLIERNVRIYIKGALLPTNMNEMDEFEQWARTVSWMNGPPNYSMNYIMRCRRDDAARNEIIRKVRVSPKDTVLAMSRHEVRIAQELLSPPGEQLFKCEMGACVDPYGTLFPCIENRCPEASYDLRKGSLEDGIADLHQRLKRLEARNPDYLRRCAKCFLKKICAQCPAMSWAEHGSMDTPIEYFCDVAHAKARFLGLIADNERAWEVTDWKERAADLQLRQAQKDISRAGGLN